MNDDIARHRDELQALCRRFHVRRLDLFGSAARGDFDPGQSDIDLLVEFDRDEPDALTLRTYLGLKEAVEHLLGRPVDLVESGAIDNPYLKAVSRRCGSPCLRRDPKSLLWDAQSAADAIRTMTAGRDFAQFNDNLMLRSAVE